MPATPAPPPTDELGRLRADLQAGILAEDWDAVRRCEERLRELLGEEGADAEARTRTARLRRSCRVHGTKRTAEQLGYSRQAVLAVAAETQSVDAVLYEILARVPRLDDLDAEAERRADRKAQRDAIRDERVDAHEERTGRSKNGGGHG